jgi:hypothetical protein
MYGKNIVAPEDHKTEGNFVQYFPGKCVLLSTKYDELSIISKKIFCTFPAQNSLSDSTPFVSWGSLISCD